MNLKPYPEYKDSGVTWLGKVPKHWEMRKTKYSFNERVQKGFPNEQLLAATQTKGVIPKTHYENRTVIAQKDLHLLKLVKQGDFVISLRSFQGGIELAHYQGIISPAYTIMNPNKEVSGGYFKHLAKSKLFIKLLTTCVTGIREGQNIDYEILKRNRLPIPTKEEQTAIACFLDYKAAQIARFVKAKKRMIELLKEQKQVIINDAVTGKIVIKDEGGRLKAEKRPDSSFIPHPSSFLQTVPEGWEVRRLKFVTSMKSGYSITSETIHEHGNYPVYGGNGLRGYTSSFTHEGLHIIIGRQGALCGNINYTTEGKFWASEHAVVVSPKIDIDLFWFGELLKAMNLNQYSIAAAQPGLSVDRILNLFVPFPNYNEQKRISESIKKQTVSLDLAISRTEREIALIQEYRTRLISDVVTGKVDVRDIKIPDVARIDDTLDESIDKPEGEEELETEEAEE